MDENNNMLDTSTVFPPETKDSFNESGAPVIKIIGVGGGGDNAVEYMYTQGIKGVSFVVVNTDRQAINTCKVPDKLIIGPGYGAGGQPEVGRKYAEDSVEQIADLFDEDIKMVFITAGMGGGTGTGAAPVIARVAREKGKLTVGIVTMPFLFEGEWQISKALAGADEMKKYVDALMVINNERLIDIYPDLNLDNGFQKADDILAVASNGISEMINKPGKQNVDIKDVVATLKDGGTAIIGSGYGEGEKRVTKAIKDALNSPLLKNNDIESSKRFCFNLYYSNETENPVSMQEMKEIGAFMGNFAKDIQVKWGRAVDNTLGDKVKITVLASGFNSSLDMNVGGSPASGTDEKVATADNDMEMKIKDLYGVEAVNKDMMNKVKFIILDKEQMDDDKCINFLEKNPTFKRGADRKLRDEWSSLIMEKTTETKEKPASKKSGGTVISF